MARRTVCRGGTGCRSMGKKTRGWPVSRILFRGRPLRRPFIWARRCRRARAANPGSWAETCPRCDPRGTPIWHCSRWGLPCRCCCQPRGGLLPHRFTLAPADRGGLFSVALSLGLPRPGVTRHRCFMESGLSSTPLAGRRGRPAIRAWPLLGAGDRAVNGEAMRQCRHDPGVDPVAGSARRGPVACAERR